MLWIVSAYLNSYVLASTTAAEEELGARIPVSFRYLTDELDHGRYTGRALPRSLHELLTVCAGKCAALTLVAALPPPAPRPIDVDGRAGGDGGGGVILLRGGRRNDHNVKVILNPRPIQRLWILIGENTRGVCLDVALPTLGGIAFCKRWHIGYTCFGIFPRAASHHHPAGDIVDKVAAAMEVDQATRVETAVPT